MKNTLGEQLRGATCAIESRKSWKLFKAPRFETTFSGLLVQGSWAPANAILNGVRVEAGEIPHPTSGKRGN